MKHSAVPLLVMILFAVGCGRSPAPAPSTTPAAPAAAMPASAPASAVSGGEADWQGYGPLQLGIDVDQLKVLWDGALQGDEGACYYLQPAGADAPRFMIEGRRFLRYDIRDAQPAPSGGHIGMTTAQLQALYPTADPLQPHKYIAGGHVLRVPATDGSQSALVFEIDAAGKVAAWRVGLPPQVDYVEGCG